MASTTPPLPRERVCLITGSTDGIGLHTATRLASQQQPRSFDRIIVHGRNDQKASRAAQLVKERSNSNDVHVDWIAADLSSLQQVRDMAATIKDKYASLACLINNAGVFMPKREESSDGFEMTWAVNCLAPYLLTGELLDLLQGHDDVRIINVSSISQSEGGGVVPFDNLQFERGYTGHDTYGLSKLVSVCFTYKLAELLRESGRAATVNCLDPGTIQTKMLDAGWGPCGIPVDRADNEFFLATSPELAGVTGKYFVSRREARSVPATYKSEIRDRVFRVMGDHTGFSYHQALDSSSSAS